MPQANWACGEEDEVEGRGGGEGTVGQSLIILKSPPSTAQIAHICHITATLTRTSAEPEDWAELK